MKNKSLSLTKEVIIITPIEKNFFSIWSILETVCFWKLALDIEVKNDFAILMGDFLTSFLLVFCWQKASKTVA